MNNILEYKGYYTKVQYSAEDGVLYGKIEGIKDLVNFEADSAKEAENEFHLAVDDYLAFCKDIGDEPDKPYRGVFNVRVSPDIHRRAAVAADKNGETLNAFVSRAIENALNEHDSKTVIIMPMPEHALSKFEMFSSRQIDGDINYGS